jgi:hypothetical protein
MLFVVHLPSPMFLSNFFFQQNFSSWINHDGYFFFLVFVLDFSGFFIFFYVNTQYYDLIKK